MKLTVGMATFDEYESVWFTVQALRIYHDMTDVEIVVVDNFGCDFLADFIESWTDAKYFRFLDVVGTSAPRDKVFELATGDVVMCIDSHVLLMPDSIKRLKDYYESNPNCMDLIQGPMLNDDLKSINTHFEPVWRSHMWGTWGCDPRGFGDEMFEIPMQGLGLFCCRKDAWLGFNKKFSGFGGEEGYIHEKFRQAGRKCLCAPWLKWVHKFGRPYSVPYPLSIVDRIANYFIGFDELNLDSTPIVQHFGEHLPLARIAEIRHEALSRR